MVRSLNADTDFFYIIAGVLLRDMLTLYMSLICQNYVLTTSIDLIKENGYTYLATHLLGQNMTQGQFFLEEFNRFEFRVFLLLD